MRSNNPDFAEHIFEQAFIINHGAAHDTVASMKANPALAEGEGDLIARSNRELDHTLKSIGSFFIPDDFTFGARAAHQVLRTQCMPGQEMEPFSVDAIYIIENHFRPILTICEPPERKVSAIRTFTSDYLAFEPDIKQWMTTTWGDVESPYLGAAIVTSCARIDALCKLPV